MPALSLRNMTLRSSPMAVFLRLLAMSVAPGLPSFCLYLYSPPASAFHPPLSSFPPKVFSRPVQSGRGLAMNQPLVYLGARLLPATEPPLPIHDAGLVSGVTVTDFCRTFRRRLFRWDDHLARFRRDCAACFIDLAVSDAELTAVAAQLV